MGCGRVGSALAHTLDEAGHSVAVIDQDSTSFRKLHTDFGGTHGHRASASTATSSRRPGIERADAFAAVSSGDNSNILAARVARETFGVENVVARIYDPRRAEVYQRLGIPTVATVAWQTDQILRRLLPEAVDDEWRDGSGKVALTQLPCADALGRPPRSAGSSASRGVRIAFLTRYGEGLLPDADTVVQADDLVHVLLDPAAARRRTPPVFAPGPEAALMRVAIAGAGKVGRSIARELLSNGHEVLLIDTRAGQGPRRRRPRRRGAARRHLRDRRPRRGRPAGLPGDDRRDR